MEIDVRLPAALGEARRKELLDAELDRGRQLVEAGVIRAIWRIPGAIKNVGVWDAADATELHEHLTSLPLFPWLTAEVTPLADHPLQRFLDG